jgi:hypothetical protein
MNSCRQLEFGDVGACIPFFLKIWAGLIEGFETTSNQKNNIFT